MTMLLLIILMTALILYGLKEWYQIQLGYKPQKTPEGTIAYIAQLLERSADSGTVLNLSSGYGGSVIGLAKRLPTWEITGVERSPTPWIVANICSIGKNFGNYRFFMKDPLEWPLKDYSVIFLHQDAKTVKLWEANIARRLQPGTLLISYNAPLPRVKPIEVLTINPATKLYIYKKPIPAEGATQALPVETATYAPPPVIPVVEEAPSIQPEFKLPL